MSGVTDHGNLTVKIDGLLLSALDLGTAQAPINADWTQLFTNGTGANQVSQMWSDTRSLAGSATENLDLAGSLTNAFGTTITFTKIKLIAVKASSANNSANNVNVQRGSTNGFVGFLAASDGFFLSPGAFAVFCWPDASGAAVTAGTGDILTITNSAGTNTVSYDIVIWGVD